MVTVTAEIEDALKNLMKLPGVNAYIVLNSDGIPMKFSANIPYSQVVHYCAGITDLLMRARRNIAVLNPNDCFIQSIRLRTKAETEIIVSNSKDYEYSMIVLQTCKTVKEAVKAVEGENLEQQATGEKGKQSKR